MLVCWGCCNQIPQTVQLKQQTFIFSQLRRPEVQGPGVCRLGFSRGHFLWPTDGCLLTGSSHALSPVWCPSVCVQIFSSYKDTSQTELGPTQWRRKCPPTPVLLSGEFHEWRSLVGYSPQGCKESDMTEQLHFHFLWILHISDVIWYLSFTVWLTSLSMTISRSIQCTAHGIISFAHSFNIHLASAL